MSLKLICIFIFSLAINYAIADQGYKGLAWGALLNDVIKGLPAKGKVECTVERQRTFFEQALHSVHSVYLSDESTKKRHEMYKFLIEPILYEESYENSEKKKYFSVQQVGSGCGLFFNGRYFGQINMANEALEEKELINHLNGTVGPGKFLTATSFSKYTGSAYRLYEFQGQETNAFLFFGEKQVVTAYFSKPLAKSIPSQLSILITNEKRIKQDKNDEDRKKKTTSQLNDL